MELLLDMELKYKASKGFILAIDGMNSIIAFTLLLTTFTYLISFGIKQIKLANINAATARYASLESTTSEQSVLNFSNNLLLDNNLESATTTIEAPLGINSPGSTIKITTTLTTPIINDIDLNFPPISHHLTVIKEGG